jgi:hypothetical protein
MSKILIPLFAVCCFTAAAFSPLEVPKATKHNMSREKLLEKIEKAADPKDVCKTWKTTLIKMEMTIPMQQHRLMLTSMYKKPDKVKAVAQMPGIPVITDVFDGKRAWKETAGLGIQEKTGRQLAFAEFECKKSNPALKLTDIYEKVELDPYLYSVGGFFCYKLICHLPKKLDVPPTQMFFDEKEFLGRYSIEHQLAEMGVVPVAISVSNYKNIEKVNFPMSMEMNMMGIKMLAKIVSFKVNVEIPDAEFKFPESEELKSEEPENKDGK